MQKMHYLNLDGEMLRTFIEIYNQRSISGAAKALDQNPSTLSHRLERLRSICGDPLFVRAGRTITPTTRAQRLFHNAEAALESMRGFIADDVFDPALLDETMTIGLTDLELSSFLIDLHKRVLIKAPNLRLDFVSNHYSDITTALRRNEFDFVLAPNSELDDADILTRVLTNDKAVCYYDANVRNAPNTLTRYLKARHVRVMFSAFDVNHTEMALSAAGLKRRSVVTLPNYSEVAEFMIGTDLVTTLPARLSNSLMKKFKTCPPPFNMGGYNYSLFWHQATNKSQKHIWLREQIVDISTNLAELQSH